MRVLTETGMVSFRPFRTRRVLNGPWEDAAPRFAARMSSRARTGFLMRAAPQPLFSPAPSGAPHFDINAVEPELGDGLRGLLHPFGYRRKKLRDDWPLLLRVQ